MKLGDCDLGRRSAAQVIIASAGFDLVAEPHQQTDARDRDEGEGIDHGAPRFAIASSAILSMAR